MSFHYTFPQAKLYHLHCRFIRFVNDNLQSFFNKNASNNDSSLTCLGFLDGAEINSIFVVPAKEQRQIQQLSHSLDFFALSSAIVYNGVDEQYR
jgi:hypothetical protein